MRGTTRRGGEGGRMRQSEGDGEKGEITARPREREKAKKGYIWSRRGTFVETLRASTVECDILQGVRHVEPKHRHPQDG